jgi:hypothetical protein
MDISSTPAAALTTFSPAITAWLKSAVAAAAGAAAGVIGNHGLPLDKAGWMAVLSAIVVAELALWTHSPITAIRVQAADAALVSPTISK